MLNLFGAVNHKFLAQTYSKPIIHEIFTSRPLFTHVVSILTKTVCLTSQKVKNLTDYSYIGGEELKIQLANLLLYLNKHNA